MSEAAVVKKTSFWREALPAIKMMMRAKWPWVIGLILVFSSGQILAFIQAPSSEIMAQLKANPNLFKEHPELAPHGGAAVILIALLGFFLALAADYIFPIFYLQMVTKEPPKPTIGGFFYWLWKSTQKNFLWILVIVILELGVGLGIGLFLIVFHFLKLPVSAVAPLIVVIGVIGALVLSFSVYFRLCLVTPLAILRKTPVIKNSRALTKGHCWRIFCGAFVLLVMFGGVFLLPIIVLGATQIHEWIGMIPKNGIPNPTFVNSGLMLPLGLLNSCLSGILIVTRPVYEFTVYRILLQEQKNNPTTVES